MMLLRSDRLNSPVKTSGEKRRNRLAMRRAPLVIVDILGENERFVPGGGEFVYTIEQVIHFRRLSAGREIAQLFEPGDERQHVIQPHFIQCAQGNNALLLGTIVGTPLRRCERQREIGDNFGGQFTQHIFLAAAQLIGRQQGAQRGAGGGGRRAGDEFEDGHHIFNAVLQRGAGQRPGACTRQPLANARDFRVAVFDFSALRPARRRPILRGRGRN